MHRFIHQIIVVFKNFTAFIIFFNPLLRASPKEEYSNLKQIYLSSSLDDNAEILAASLSKSYWSWFDLILSSRTLSSSVNVIFIKDLKGFL